MLQKHLVFFGGTVGNNRYRKTIIEFATRLGYPHQMFYDPTVPIGTWGPHEQQKEDEAAENSAIYIYYNGNPMQEGNPISAYSLQRTGQILTRYGENAAAVFDIESMPEGHVRAQLQRAWEREREFHPNAAIFTNLHDLLGWLLPRLEKLHLVYVASVALRAKVARSILMQFTYGQLYYEGSALMRREILEKAVAQDWQASDLETRNKVKMLFDEQLSALIEGGYLEGTNAYVRAKMLHFTEAEFPPAFALSIGAGYSPNCEFLDPELLARIESILVSILATEKAVRRYHIGNGEAYREANTLTVPIALYSHDASSDAHQRLQEKLQLAWTDTPDASVKVMFEIKLHPFTPTIYDRL